MIQTLTDRRADAELEAQKKRDRAYMAYLDQVIAFENRPVPEMTREEQREQQRERSRARLKRERQQRRRELQP